MTQNPYSPHDQQAPLPPQPPPLPGQPMNIYPAPGAYGGAYPGQQASRPSWPTVVGVISLCVAGLFGLMTAVGPLFSAVAERFQSAQQREMMASMPDWHGTYKWLGTLFGVGMYVVLGIGGAMLLKRRRAGRTLHITYALMGILMAMVGVVAGVMIMDHLASATNIPARAQGVFRASMVVGLLSGLAFGLAYPVFLLIWFSRPNVKAETRLWP